MSGRRGALNRIFGTATIDEVAMLDRWIDDFMALARQRGMPAHLDAKIRPAARALLGAYVREMLGQQDAARGRGPL